MSVLHAFVYNAVDVNKIATALLKCAISLRIISIAYLIGQSLVKILSQIPAL